MRVLGFPGGSVEKNLPASAGDTRDMSSIPGLGRCPGRKQQLKPVFLPVKSHGQRILVGYSPQGHQELDTTERLNVCVCFNVLGKLINHPNVIIVCHQAPLPIVFHLDLCSFITYALKSNLCTGILAIKM